MARSPRPRLVDIARALGVSVTTVSNAFNRPDQLSSARRAAVLARADALGYRGPGAEGRLLRPGRAGASALCNPEPIPYLLEDPLARAFIKGLMLDVQARQVGLVLLPTAPHAVHARPRVPAALDVAAVDGVVLYSLARDDPVIERALSRGRPVVTVDMDRRDGLASVGIDDRAGAALAASHLIARGHRRFAVIALPTSRERIDRAGSAAELEAAAIHPTAERWRGYRDAFARAGLDPQAVPIRVAAVNARSSGRGAARALLACPPDGRPTALLRMSDVLALGVRDQCVSLGLRVPDDVAVVGYDDLPEEAARAGLTTGAQDGEAKGRAAGAALLDGVPAGSRVLPTELRIRASSGGSGLP